MDNLCKFIIFLIFQDQFAVGHVQILFTKDSCAAASVCMLKPEFCDPAKVGECEYAVSIGPSQEDVGWVDMMMQSRIPAGGGPNYVAIGFSSDNKMGKDAVTHCVNPGSGLEAVHKLSFNQASRRQNVLVTGEHNHMLKLMGSAVIGSDFVCHIRQQIERQVFENKTFDNSRIWPLNKEYYILVAAGSANADHSLNNHNVTGRQITNTKFRVDKPRSKDATEPGGFRKIKTRITKKECGKSRVCLLEPVDCDPEKKGNCKSAVTIAPSKEDAGWVDIMMQRTIPTTEAPHYIALGFSKDENMGDNAVPHVLIYCTNIGTGQPLYGRSFNVEIGKNNLVLPFEGTTGSIKLMGEGVIESDFICHIRQKIKQDGSRRGRKRRNADSGIWPLDKPYHLSVATGPASADGKLQRPDDTPKSIDNKIQEGSLKATSFSGISETKLNLMKAHGILMIMGWWFFVTLGIFFARYFRPIWINWKPYGKAVWFQGTEAGATHSILGLICCLIVFIQPILAFKRPHPDQKNRSLFNFGHRFLGITAWTMAFTTIWYASNFSFFEFEDWGDAPCCMMIIFVGCVVVAVIILEINLFFDAMIKPHPNVTNALELNPNSLDPAMQKPDALCPEKPVSESLSPKAKIPSQLLGDAEVSTTAAKKRTVRSKKSKRKKKNKKSAVLPAKSSNSVSSPFDAGTGSPAEDSTPESEEGSPADGSTPGSAKSGTESSADDSTPEPAKSEAGCLAQASTHLPLYLARNPAHIPTTESAKSEGGTSAEISTLPYPAESLIPESSKYGSETSSEGSTLPYPAESSIPEFTKLEAISSAEDSIPNSAKSQTGSLEKKDSPPYPGTPPVGLGSARNPAGGSTRPAKSAIAAVPAAPAIGWDFPNPAGPASSAPVVALGQSEGSFSSPLALSPARGSTPGTSSSVEDSIPESTTHEGRITSEGHLAKQNTKDGDAKEESNKLQDPKPMEPQLAGALTDEAAQLAGAQFFLPKENSEATVWQSNYPPPHINERICVLGLVGLVALLVVITLASFIAAKQRN